MKLHISYLYCAVMSLLVGLSSCWGEGQSEGEGHVYELAAQFDVDSTVVLDHLMVYADSHAGLYADTLIISPQHMVSWQRRTPGLDEVYLCSDAGELCRLYASGGMAVSVALAGKADSLVVSFATEGDSINPWLAHQTSVMDSLTAPQQRRALMDSLCHQLPSDVRCALLLRDEVAAFEDSVFVRRCLGALTAEAKPEWLMQSIDHLLTIASASASDRSRRLSAGDFQVNDSTDFDMATSRSDYLLIYCWADYDEASIDSLYVLRELYEDEYDMKRLQFLSCCLHAADSAAWYDRVDDLQGMHVWLQAGLSDPRVRHWGVERVPTLILCDMYNNVQRRNVWGQELRDALSRIPNRSGFAHTPKTKPSRHGR